MEKQVTFPYWRQIQRRNFTSLEELSSFLQLSPMQREQLFGSPRFSLNVPRRLAEKMRKGDLFDPLLRQFVPLREEQAVARGFVKDPVQDLSFQKEKKLLQKYHGRALLLTTGACAMHCRFCFRQHFPYETEEHGFERELALLREDPSCRELILSGGDPLSLSDRVLGALFEALEEIPHLRRIRFHSRFPIGIPERIDDALISLLRRSSKQLYFVLHVNHPRELDDDIFAALASMQRAGIVILSQSVLLKDVNDLEETLISLYELLIDRGILPYYLHCLDPVEGMAHYALPETRAIEIYRALKAALSGYGVPRLVREEPGRPSKTDVFHFS